MIFFLHCVPDDRGRSQKEISALAANKDVAEYMSKFEGRGQQIDESKLPTTEEMLGGFEVAPDLTIDLVLSEPAINQPVEINFDHKGRLWVVQYAQYPYPEGLKVTKIDHHIRMTFDKKPKPPPLGQTGADKITFFEDTNGDGIYDQSTDAITGLNIATAVTWGRGKIWVLNPPYLLAYPDANDDGLPDGDPVVHLDGFGLEDTHAVANSLRWGPDGWLYGATGSTVHSSISTSRESDIYFEGQSIWRYHPEKEIFEIFAEGGGNTFHVEIDDKGRIYSGTNGSTRGQYYKQGAYYTKNWGKHGALTNDFAFGFLPDMKFKGEPLRFTHAWIKYQGGSLPRRYHDKMVAINPLHNFLLLTDMENNGSTFTTSDVEKIVVSDQRWFRPVDIKVGPDGGIYIADWSDSRLSHVNPTDDWHRNSGRIYRLRSKEFKFSKVDDVSQYSMHRLIHLLDHPNKWYRQQALRQFGDRHEGAAVELLVPLLEDEESGKSLEALWAVYQSGGWSDRIARLALRHKDPDVRRWGIRLLADQSSISRAEKSELMAIAKKEVHPEVISQLASSARRVPAQIGIQIFRQIAARVELSDPDNPMLLWWAIESSLDGQYPAVLRMFEDKSLWSLPAVSEIVLERLMQRTILKGTKSDFDFATALFERAPDQSAGEKLVEGFLKGVIGQQTDHLPKELVAAKNKFDRAFNQHPIVQQIVEKDSEAIAKGLQELMDPSISVAKRQALIEVFSQHHLPGAESGLLELVKSRSTPASLIVQGLSALRNYPDKLVGDKILDAYPDHLRANTLTRTACLQTLISRPDWLDQLWHEITSAKTIHSNDLTREMVRQMHWMSDEVRKQEIEMMWPTYYPPDEDREAEMQRVLRLVADDAPDDVNVGKRLFDVLCRSCHVLHQSGGDFGPDLTGYDRRDPTYLALHIVDPDIDVREGFSNYTLQTRDNQYFMGMIKERSSRQVSLQMETGEVFIFNMDQVLALEPEARSVMPAGLLTNLPDQQIRDLFSYLMAD